MDSRKEVKKNRAQRTGFGWILSRCTKAVWGKNGRRCYFCALVKDGLCFWLKANIESVYPYKLGEGYDVKEIHTDGFGLSI